MYQKYIDDILEEKFFDKKYIGKYDIIVKEIKEKEEEFKEKTSELILNNNNFKKIISDFCERNNLIEENNDFDVIYPISANYFLIPTYFNTINKESKSLQYFLCLPEKDTYKIYKWTYFNDTIIDRYDSSIKFFHEQISKLTIWNSSFYYLEDIKFWNEYVFKNENGNYKYLKEL
jgi:hypothetical protein